MKSSNFSQSPDNRADKNIDKRGDENTDDDSFAAMMKEGAVPLPASEDLAPQVNIRQRLRQINLPPCDADVSQFEQKSSYPESLSREDKKALKGDFMVSLDLHGQTVQQAYDELQNFLGTLSNGVRLVKIVHGRGQHSPKNIAVLRGKVRGWMARCPQVQCYKTEDNGGTLLAVLSGEK